MGAFSQFGVFSDAGGLLHAGAPAPGMDGRSELGVLGELGDFAEEGGLSVGICLLDMGNLTSRDGFDVSYSFLADGVGICGLSSLGGFPVCRVCLGRCAGFAAGGLSG